METCNKNIPAIAMRGLTVFPRMNTSFDLERPISVHALERAMETGRRFFSSPSVRSAWSSRRKRTCTRSARSRA